jgi:hypothetical protein
MILLYELIDLIAHIIDFERHIKVQMEYSDSTDLNDLFLHNVLIERPKLGSKLDNLFHIELWNFK